MLCVAHLGLPVGVMLIGPLLPLSGEALLSDLAEAMGDVLTLRDARSTGPCDALLARNLSIRTAPDLASASAPAFTVQVTFKSELVFSHYIRRLGELQHEFYGSPPACLVLRFLHHVNNRPIICESSIT